MTNQNPALTMDLDTAVVEVFSLLHGLDLTYDPSYDRFRVITRALNRALRANALEHEWSWYHHGLQIEISYPGMWFVDLPLDVRPRQTGDDSVRLVDTETLHTAVFAYFLPRDALRKYAHRQGLWCSVVQESILFSRALREEEGGLGIQCPVMREPVMFELPKPPKDPNDPLEPVPDYILEQPVDFLYPDVITARAAYMYSLTDPVVQPRSQTLEANYKDLMYQAIERDDNYTDSPYQNEFFVPVQNSIFPESTYRPYPLADERR